MYLMPRVVVQDPLQLLLVLVQVWCLFTLALALVQLNTVLHLALQQRRDLLLLPLQVLYLVPPQHRRQTIHQLQFHCTHLDQHLWLVHIMVLDQDPAQLLVLYQFNLARAQLNTTLAQYTVWDQLQFNINLVMVAVQLLVRTVLHRLEPLQCTVLP